MTSHGENAPQARNLTLEMPGGVRVVVPDGLDCLTAYVLYEQRDWFEVELDFLRHWLKPGQRAIDVGANYGVYALSIAKLVGASGAVWAFEPSSTTAAFLKQGIEANAFAHVELACRALSDASGTAQLSVNRNAELNSLVREGSCADSTETVPVSTLDECMRSYGWQNIDFLKLDAEGEESNIIRGGEQFLSQHSPLILYEIKAGDDLHLGLVNDFAERGYDSFRLVPGLGVLVPFDANSPPDDYLLNLFCCKKDRAKSLAENGLLLDVDALAQAAASFGAVFASQSARYIPADFLSAAAYGASLSERWAQSTPDSGGEASERAIQCFAMSRDSSLPRATRYCALQASVDLLRSLCERASHPTRLSSLARVSHDYGARNVAVRALQRVSDLLSRQQRVDMNAPFLAPSERFSAMDPRHDLDKWFLAAILEQSERLETFSSYFADGSALPRLETIASLGFEDAQMKRRLQLMRMRFPANA